MKSALKKAWQLPAIFQRLWESSRLAYLVALSGWVLYFIQSSIYVHIQTMVSDEGGYLYAGNLFAQGILRPFQDYGLIRNYAPLAYLIPGQIEAWFGAGLRTGRFFSVFCGMIMVVALWLTARRLSSKWWAAAVVWAVVLTPISIQIYSMAITEALVACLLVCSLLFFLGPGRSLWQIISGSILAGLTVMTRHNLIPLVPLLVAYVFWQDGKKAGWWALVASLLPILVIHALYWPNILELWAIWLPARFTPFLDPYRVVSTNIAGSSEVQVLGRLSSFLQGIRFHYFTMVGFCVCLFLWPKRNDWANEASKRAAYFLAALFLVLALLHAWASFIITNPVVSCTFCFTPYLAFFDVTVFLLIIVCIPSWKKTISPFVLAIILLFTLILAAGLGYAAFDRFGVWIMNLKFPAITRGWDPRQWSPFITLWDILSNKFHQDLWDSRAPVAAIAGLIVGLLSFAAGKLIYDLLLKKGRISGYSFGAFFLILILCLGVILSPLMGGTYRQNGICPADVLRRYEEIGSTIRENVPENSRVYWAGHSIALLLYAPTLKVFYPQIYPLSFYRPTGDSQQLLKHGLWTAELSRQWLSESTVIITASDWFTRPDYPGDAALLKYNVIRSIPANPCDPSSYILIYTKKP